MRMLSASLTATSAVIALALSGYVPVPASVSLFGSAAQAKQPRQGSPKAKGKKPRTRAKGKAPAAKQQAKSRKQGTRKASGQNARPRTTALASKPPARSAPRKVSRAGARHAANLEAKAVAVRAATAMGLSVGQTGAAGPTAARPTAAKPTGQRARPKRAAAPAKQAAKARKNDERRIKGANARPRQNRVARGPAGRSRTWADPGNRKLARMIARLGRPPNYAPPQLPAPPRAATSPRRTAKASAPPARQRASIASKESRNASKASSTITRLQPLGGGAPITAAQAPRAKQGKKSRFYFNPFRGWFGGGKKT